VCAITCINSVDVRECGGFVLVIEPPRHEFMIGVPPWAKQQRELFVAFAPAVTTSDQTLPAADSRLSP